MSSTIFDLYEVSFERGIRLWAEMVVYLLQRRCHCKNPCKCINEDKAIPLVRHWPGTQLTWQEEQLVHYLAGKAAMVPAFLSRTEEAMEIDLGMGAEYCIQKLEKKGAEIFKLMDAEERVKHQTKWN